MKPRILMHLSMARAHMGGGALSMWRTAEALRERGYPLRVTATQVFTGKIRGTRVARLSSADLKWADVVLTTAGSGSAPAYRQDRRHSRPVVAFVHSAVHPPRLKGASLVVWGSAALRDRCLEKGFTAPGDEMVLWPPLDPDAVRVDGPGNRVTLVNLSADKGAHLFWTLAERMPDVPFLGVRGGWNLASQVIPHPLPDNAEVMQHQPDPREVYRRTKALLYLRGPQSGPDWLNGVGLAAMEAAVSGIPTVAHPGPGLRESMADAATWVDSDDPAEWEAAIRAVLADHDARSAAALERGATFGASEGLDRLVAALDRLAVSAEVLAPC